MSTDLAPAVTEAAARESVSIALTQLGRAAEQVVWQIEHQVWTVLGYSSWDEMREAEYGGVAVMVPRADRPELVARMHRAGRSQQEIGDTLGVSIGTVNTDVQNFSSEDSPDRPVTRTDSLGRERPTAYAPRPEPTPRTGEAGDAAVSAPPADDPASPDDDDADAPAPTRPARSPLPSMPAPRDYEQENAEQNAQGLAHALTYLFPLPNQGFRARLVADWRRGHEGASPSNRGRVTPESMHAIAGGLTALAHEWEQ